MSNFQLSSHESIPPPKGPVMVCILDGYGENEYKDEFNAVVQAKTPCFDKLREKKDRFSLLDTRVDFERGKQWRWAQLATLIISLSDGRVSDHTVDMHIVTGLKPTVRAHGTAVGLPTDADMGNSEVGHNALGSGRVVDQGARLVDIALEDGSLFKSDGWKHIEPALEKSTLHLIGLCSDGGVHSRMSQVYKLVEGAVDCGCKRIRVHALADGRDVEDGSSTKFFKECQDFLLKISKEKDVDACIASGGGRMHVTMDRYEADWAIVQRGYEAHVLGEAENDNTFKDPVEAVKALRNKSGDPQKPVSDQFLESFVIVDDDNKPVGTVEDGDAVVIFNFRADRVVQLSKALEYEDFKSFDRKRWPKILFAGIMQYDGDLKLPANYLVPPPTITKVSGQYLAASGKRTFAISETQKFGHVTFFWNGNRSGYMDSKLETYLEIPSDKVVFNEKPEMKAREITDAAKEAIKSGKYDMIRVNFANPDMVGHTGDLKATIFACEVVDKCLQELLTAVDTANGRWLITSDHGNADDMVQRDKKGKPLTDSDGKPIPLTSHTLSPVGVAIGGKGLPEKVKMKKDLEKAGLANITATFMNLLGLAAPKDYEPSLICTA